MTLRSHSLLFARKSFRGDLRALLVLFLAAALSYVQAQPSPQPAPVERTFRQSKTAIEKALKELEPSMGGRLPALDGFALPGEHPLSRYQRAYYQSSVQVNATASGGSVVRVTTKVTAWYADPTASHSGYQLLTSNGRLESDLLDQLSDILANNSGAPSASRENTRETATETAPVAAPPPAAAKRSAPAEKSATTRRASIPAASEPPISAPTKQLPDTGGTFTSSVQSGLSSQLAQPKTPQDKTTAALQAEAASLEEVLKNQAHPKNLVAIKKTGTPVVASPSLTAKTLFLASAHDEFEMLDFNADWVHVRMSGLSRGWIWRTSLEMPEGISDVPTAKSEASPVVADLFQVTREETAPFPGDWEPLRGKSVKIISVQKIQENEKDSGAQAKLEYAKSLLDKNYAELASKAKELAGVVMIFDSIDGGMIAMTLPTVQQWKAGKLTDAALWHSCYFDPPETFTVPASAGGQ